ncbi:MAG: TetR/AcrR family transcriptional regulator [Sporomusaceae bacterium]|nr:TetR/AcrR family transcriptional regulator [Sporomusaceae bacterium]
MKERILATALHLMNVHGVKFTTADLARELGVSKRAVYEHFPSKEYLMAAIFDSIITDFRQQISVIARTEGLDIVTKLKSLMVYSPKALGPLNEKIIPDIQRFLPKEWMKFEEYFQERWRMIEQVINQGIENELLSPVDLAVLHKMYLGTIDSLLDYQFLAKNNTTFKSAMTKAADIIIRGLTAPGCHKRSPADVGSLSVPPDKTPLVFPRD